MKMQWKKLFTCLLSGILLLSLLMAAPANQLSVKAAPAINNANKKSLLDFLFGYRRTLTGQDRKSISNYSFCHV